MFIGPPLSGKAEHAATASHLLNLPVVSADDLIKANESTFAAIRRTGISGMDPHTDPVLNRLFRERLEKGDLSGGMILEGYPSTKDHGDYLRSLITDGTLPMPLVIQLEIPDAVVLERAPKASGDSVASIDQRLKDYHREMDMLHLYFPAADVVHIDAAKPTQQIDGEIGRILKARFAPAASGHP